MTLYGIVDAGFTYTNNQKGESAYQATQGNVQGSRWGLLGSEDLGGGNKVLFKLENGFSLESWRSPARAAACSAAAHGLRLSNNTAGTITLGRQYNSVQDYLSNMQINGVGAMSQYGNAIYDNDDHQQHVPHRQRGQVHHADYAGFTANAMYAFSNTAGQFANNRAWSVGADYVNGPLHLDAAYSLVNQPATNTAGAAPSDNYYSTSSSIISGVQRNQVWGAGGVVRVRPGNRRAAVHELAIPVAQRRQPAFRQLRSQREVSVHAGHVARARLHLHDAEHQRHDGARMLTTTS